MGASNVFKLIREEYDNNVDDYSICRRSEVSGVTLSGNGAVSDASRQEGVASCHSRIASSNEERKSPKLSTSKIQEDDMHVDYTCHEYADSMVLENNIGSVSSDLSRRCADNQNPHNVVTLSTSHESFCTNEHLEKEPDHCIPTEMINEYFVDIHLTEKNTPLKNAGGIQNEIKDDLNCVDEISTPKHQFHENKAKYNENGTKASTKYDKEPVQCKGTGIDGKKKKPNGSSMLVLLLASSLIGFTRYCGNHSKEPRKTSTNFNKKDKFKWSRTLQGNPYKNKKKIRRNNKKGKYTLRTKKTLNETLKWLTAYRKDRGILRIHLYPTFRNSLDSLFNSSTNRQTPFNDMRFEWMRLRSFGSYSGAASPIVLSRSGFYFTGNEHETKCFSCAATYSRWTDHDDVLHVHRQISPHCRHLLGNDERNVSIGHRENFLQNVSPTEHEISSRNNLNGETLERNSVASLEVNYQNGVTSSPFTTTSTANHNADVQHPIPSSRPNSIQNSSLEAATFGPGNITSGQSPGVSRASINKLSPLGVNFDKPRYPQFAVPSVRLSTYNKWQATQLPQDMSEAGFVYAGYADYARCFFCGGGLKNWKTGDDPWTEHARWFPRCTYVRQNKGERFIQLVHGQAEKQEDTTQSTGAASNHSELESYSQKSCAKDLHLSPSYQSVRELGYSSDSIESAVHRLLLQGKINFNSRDILETIFNMEDGDNTVTRSSASYDEARTDSADNIGNEDMKEALKLMEENERLKEQTMCIFCRENQSTVSFLPCGHLVCCDDCAPAMKNCPRCNEWIQATVKTFWA